MANKEESNSPPKIGKDKRNLQWKQNNIGSTMLQKMGWKSGQGVGKRQRLLLTTIATDNDNDNDNNDDKKNNSKSFCTEGLRIIKRQDGLGLGANTASNDAPVIHDSFSQLLHTLQQEHTKSTSDNDDDNSSSSSSQKKKKKKKKKRKKKSKATESNTITLPTNRAHHSRARVHHAKFSQKSDEDMACIFGTKKPLQPQTLENKEKDKKETKKSKKRNEDAETKKDKKKKKKRNLDD